MLKSVLQEFINKTLSYEYSFFVKIKHKVLAYHLKGVRVPQVGDRCSTPKTHDHNLTVGEDVGLNLTPSIVCNMQGAVRPGGRCNYLLS